jgi:hypothetical protein
MRKKWRSFIRLSISTQVKSNDNNDYYELRAKNYKQQSIIYIYIKVYLTESRLFTQITLLADSFQRTTRNKIKTKYPLPLLSPKNQNAEWHNDLV